MSAVFGQPGAWIDVRFVVVTGLSGFGLETLKVDIAARCLDRLLSKDLNLSCRSGLSNKAETGATAF